MWVYRCAAWRPRCCCCGCWSAAPSDGILCCALCCGPHGGGAGPARAAGGAADGPAHRIPHRRPARRWNHAAAGAILSPATATAPARHAHGVVLARVGTGDAVAGGGTAAAHLSAYACGTALSAPRSPLSLPTHSTSTGPADGSAVSAMAPTQSRHGAQAIAALISIKNDQKSYADRATQPVFGATQLAIYVENNMYKELRSRFLTEMVTLS